MKVNTGRRSLAQIRRREENRWLIKRIIVSYAAIFLLFAALLLAGECFN